MSREDERDKNDAGRLLPSHCTLGGQDKKERVAVQEALHCDCLVCQHMAAQLCLRLMISEPDMDATLRPAAQSPMRRCDAEMALVLAFVDRR